MSILQNILELNKTAKCYWLMGPKGPVPLVRRWFSCLSLCFFFWGKVSLAQSDGKAHEPMWKPTTARPMCRWRHLVCTTTGDRSEAQGRVRFCLACVVSVSWFYPGGEKEREGASHGGQRIHWTRDWDRWANQSPHRFRRQDQILMLLWFRRSVFGLLNWLFLFDSVQGSVSAAGSASGGGSEVRACSFFAWLMC